MRHLALLLLIAASSIAQEIPVSDPTFEPQAAGTAAVAASGDRFITAWERGDNRGVYFSLTDLGGDLLRGPVTVALTGGRPQVASGLNSSLIAWLDGTTAYTALIDRDGNVSAPAVLYSQPPFTGPVSQTPPRLGEPVSVVWNGSRFLVLFRLYPSGVIGFLVDQNGQSTAGPFPISDWTATATADDGGFLAFATVPVDPPHPEQGFTIQGRRIDSTGAMSALTPTATDVLTFVLPNLAAVGHQLFWEQRGVVHRVVTDSMGAGLSESIVQSDGYQLRKAVQTPAGTLLALFEFAPRWWLNLVDSNGKLLGRKDVPFSSDVAAIGGRAMLAATDPLRGYFADVGSTIQLSDPLDIGRMAVEQMFPQIASDGALQLTAWIERSTAQVFAARIDALAHKHLDGRGILIDSQAYGAAPAVAQLGDGWIVAYLEVSSGVAHLKIRHVFPDGTLDAAPTLVSTTAQPYAPRLASDGDQALLVWTENTYKIRATRISRDGTIIDPAFLKISDADDVPLGFAPDVGIDGDGYLVAWQAQRTAPLQIHVSAVRVTRSGTVLDPRVILPMIYGNVRVAGSTVAGTNGANVFVDPLGGTPVDLGTQGFGDVEPFADGVFVIGSDPRGLWAAVVADNSVRNRFTIALPAAANQPSLTQTSPGLAVTYLRAAGDEGFGGSLRAYVLPISGQPRRPALRAR